MGRSSGFLLHSIIDALVDDLFHILIKIVGNIRDLEDDVFNEQLAIAKEISLTKGDNIAKTYCFTTQKNYGLSY